MATEAAPARPGRSTRYALVDCDVHPHLKSGLGDLMPYLPDGWRRRLGVGQDEAWAKEIYASRFSLPHNVMYINPAGVVRRDALTPGGARPASDPAAVRSQLLDEWGIDRAVLIGGDVFGLGALPDADLAAVVAAAYNDWLCERWLAFDERFRATLVVGCQDPAQAAREIARTGDRPGVVGVFLPLTNVLMGERHYWPIYEAAAERGLPIVLHPNSVDGVYSRGPQLAGGVFTYYTEWHTALTQIFQASLISLVCQGVFERYPQLKLVIAEGGFAWLPDVLWRLDKDWRALRSELPWLKRPPSEYVFDHVRFTTQPIPEPVRPEHLRSICEIVQASRTLLFSSDYPHWDFDSPLRALDALDEPTRERVRAANAEEVFGSRL